MENALTNRLDRERATIRAMIMIYCSDKHGRKSVLCPECTCLKEYAFYRLDKCPFGDAKPTCVNCTVHCYQAAMRDAVKRVMRYSGPKMIFRHPLLALFHVIDSYIYKPKSKADKKKNRTQDYSRVFR